MDRWKGFKSYHLSWSGSPQAWQGVAEKAEKKRGLLTGWAKKTNRSALYTIDYDAEGWYQVDLCYFLHDEASMRSIANCVCVI